MVVRLSKALLVGAMGFFALLVAFGNVTDYHTNFQFVRHVLLMDTLFPGNTIGYRSITTPWLHHVAYASVIALEALTGLLCLLGCVRLLRSINHSGASFNARKTWAIAGLTLGFLTWQVVFMSVGGEWFGMWMSKEWNGVPDAFRFFVTIGLVLIYLVQPDTDADS